MNPLKKWRKSQKFTQIELAEKVGEYQTAISRYESGEDIPPETLNKFKKMGYKGPGIFEKINMEEEVKNPMRQPGTLSGLDVSDAWAILYEACHASNSQPMKVDVRAFGRLLAVVAEKLSQGTGENARRELLEMARDFVGAMEGAQK